MPRSRHAATSEETRQRLIEAGLELFAAHGLDGVTTRALCARAGVNQAAIPYHFGGKEGVYLAVADEICAALAALLDPLRAAAREGTPAEALPRLMGEMFRLSQADPRNRMRFAIMSFEQQHPGPAFERFHARLHVPLMDTIGALLAAIGNEPPGALSVQVRAHALLGLVSAFISGRASAARHLGQDDQLDPARREAIEAGVRQLAADLVAGLVARRPG
jgi:AcrR family transcriptional regulator